MKENDLMQINIQKVIDGNYDEAKEYLFSCSPLTIAKFILELSKLHEYRESMYAPEEERWTLVEHFVEYLDINS